MASLKPGYTITADCGRQGHRTKTRALAASAQCIADRWADEGCTNIIITTPNGVAFNREEFRATLPLVRWMAERRR